MKVHYFFVMAFLISVATASAVNTTFSSVGTVKSFKTQLDVPLADCKASYGEKGGVYGWGCHVDYPGLVLKETERAVNCAQTVVVGSDNSPYSHQCGNLSRSFKFTEGDRKYTVQLMMRLVNSFVSTKGLASRVDIHAHEETWKKPIDRLDLIEKAIAELSAKPLVLYVDRVE